MKERIAGALIAQLASAQRSNTTLPVPWKFRQALKVPSSRLFSLNAHQNVESRVFDTSPHNKEEAVTIPEDQNFDDHVAQSKGKQTRTPWHRDGSSLPPVSRPRRAGAMVKGKLLTTPSRLLKLIIPLVTSDKNTDRKDVEPLALLVHPQQPLSYLERLIQSELPSVKDSNGKDVIPSVNFRAQDSAEDEIERSGRANEQTNTDNTERSKSSQDRRQELSQSRNDKDLEETNIDGKLERTGVLNRDSASRVEAMELRGGPGEGGVETYGGKGREAEGKSVGSQKFVRWSSSTEVGDFIRDAARGKEFAVEIQGAPREIRVGVPSFGDRTHYLRQRLRRISSNLSDMTSVKKECDKAALKGAQRVAMGGFAGLCSWWFSVYFLTFKTGLGWDFMEPITYLVGLSGLMGGYLWFLYHNREMSYRSALNLTISRRQMKLYQLKGFDLERWEGLIREGNELRREIKAVATEYDVEWDEKNDTSEQVAEALREDRQKQEENEEKEKGDNRDK